MKKSKVFSIKEVRPNIFLFEFRNHYDMCMYFLRYQEFYESSSPKFRNNIFEIFDFMKWYTFKYGKGSFTYPNDWNGFNIPGDIIPHVWSLGIPDKNKYDLAMYNAWAECKDKVKDKFYIIGVVKGNKALDHEIAHGLFFLNKEYKKEMTKLVKALPNSLKKSINEVLKKLGYTPKVYIDETQAYMATGLPEVLEKIDQCIDARKAFQDCFKKFTRKSK
jgi:hypothetical protein